MNARKRQNHTLGMRLRRDNTSLQEVESIKDVFVQDIIQGWDFMDQLILGLDMLEGRA